MSMKTVRSLSNDLPDFVYSFVKNCELTNYSDITLAWTLRRLPQMKTEHDIRLMPWGYKSHSNNSTNITAAFISDVRSGAVASVHYYGGLTLFSTEMSPKQKMHDLHSLVLEGMLVR